MTKRNAWIVLAIGAVALGCGPAAGPNKAETKPTVHAEGKKYLLDAEPTGAKSVLDTRKDAKNGDDIVMVGRIAGSEKPFVDGRATFSVTDLTIKPCDPEEKCPTPWDNCCTPKEELTAGTAQIKFEGGDGKTISVGAKDLLGVKELAVVVVKGKAKRDDQGNLTVVASGIFTRPEPK